MYTNNLWSMTTSHPTCVTPELHITRNKSRLKIYSDKKVYLQNGDNFELEVFNSNSTPIGFRIKLNGQYISSSKLVVQPGQRVYLERFIDTNAKFKFDTYTVEANNKQVDQAIANNGQLEVEFYSIAQPVVKYGTSNIVNYSPSNYYYNSPSTEVPYTFTNSCSATMDFIGQPESSNFKTLKSVLRTAEVKETGRIEAGPQSSQKFSTVDYNFNTLPFATESIQLLPVSEKPLEVEKIRNYCTGCSYRVRDEKWKFCPKCGTEI